ncbi:MAG TPA: 23S rRNA (adenine(2030)-N(6))-methyltransferase RlmJ [Rhizomicrobium sp.]|jgi:23S rRNA (adenine2030-N6)-methyltransferase|nr:23S rRNA (adenine(2030)-N(6))-methyltransferase RlmJ [Rhizomicrobium sp.]
MNYRHGYHAGNFADVVKHVALVAVLLHLRKKDAAFSVIDSHAGRGLYDLSGDQALRTGEAQAGIARLLDIDGAMPEALSTYLSLVKEGSGGGGTSAKSGATIDRYPGSPMIAAKLLRPQDRLTAIEKHPQEFAALKDVLSPFRNATAENADGYARAMKLLPPPSRRGLVLMDPPFESPDEFSALAQAARDATGKFATGITLIWYPIKSQAEADGFVGEVLAGGIAKAMGVVTKVTAAGGKLNRAGLVVVNPPYGFEAQMRAAAGLVAPRLQGEIGLAWLAGSE